MKREGTISSALINYSFGLFIILHLEAVVCGGLCVEENCDYGCCSNDCCSYPVSTSVLIVAGIVGGLIVVALVVAIVICLIKTYRDKRASRIRQLRPGQRQLEDQVPRRPAVPRKPPEYTEEPPPYSSEMPESHYRPVTVNANYFSYNTRFRTPVMQNYPQSQTHSNNNLVHGNRSNHARRVGVVGIPEAPNRGNHELQTHLPGTPLPDRPPTYSEEASSQAETQRRRRFIQTPPRGHVVTENNVSESTVTNNQLPETQESTETLRAISLQTLTENTNTVNRENNSSRHDNSSQSNIINTQDLETNNAVLIERVQTESDQNNTRNALTPQTQRPLSNSNHHARQTNMEMAVSRARSRQTAAATNQQTNQAVSRRHTDNIRSRNDVNNSNLGELACL